MPSRVSLHRTLDHGLPVLPLRSAIVKRRAEKQPGASEEAYGPNTSVMAPDRRRKPSLFLHSQKARQLAFAVEKPEVVGCFRSFRVIIRDPRTESPVS